MLCEEQFCSNSEQIKSFNKNFCQKSDNSMETIEGHVDKSSVDYDVDKMIKEKKFYKAIKSKQNDMIFQVKQKLIQLIAFYVYK